MPSLGFPELLLIMGIVIILFGYKRIGHIGKGLGEGIRNFKDSLRQDEDEEADTNKADSTESK